MHRAYFRLSTWLLVLGAAIWSFAFRWGSLPPLELLIDPWDGLYRTARAAREPAHLQVRSPALQAEVRIVRDRRGVPHVFAQRDEDLAFALGYLMARDRLFQMDFMARVASGRLAEVLGPAWVETDRELRRTGMAWAARRAAERLRQEQGLEWRLLEAFSAGVNAYRDRLRPQEDPLEFRLLGYRPERWTPEHSLRVALLQAFELTFVLNDLYWDRLSRQLGPEAAAELYPQHSPLAEPLTPEPQGIWRDTVRISVQPGGSGKSDRQRPAFSALLSWLQPAEGQGSNNWAVAPWRARGGGALLAGDPHLRLTLPAIWYEVHLVSPSRNLYGVAIPGTPAIVIGFNDHVAWSLTNTGADVLDLYALRLDTERRHYWYQGAWRRLRIQIDTIRVRGGREQIDTLQFTHHGPVFFEDGRPLALRWVGHEGGRLLRALWGFGGARNWADFEAASRFWDVPAQNVLYADRSGTIAIRSCGLFPLRRSGHGRGVLDGTTDSTEWAGWIPFSDLPASVNPARGWLASANQDPVPPDYPYYLGYHWPNPFRARRIRQLLEALPEAGVEDFRRMQTDVGVWLFLRVRPWIERLTAERVWPDSTRARAAQLLARWDGTAGVNRPEPLIFWLFWRTFRERVWDEVPADVPRPRDAVLLDLLERAPQSRWFDRLDTPARETAEDLLRQSLHAALDTLLVRYGTDPEGWAWGRHHRFRIDHVTRSSALRALGRGPYPAPGFWDTLWPAGELETVHSASWRMIVRFSSEGPEGYGVYPGGSSGNPFSRYYVTGLESWLKGSLFPLRRPTSPEQVPPQERIAMWTLRPAAE
nr:MAG: penicillin amidase [Bacteroidota bacterium]